ncbi:MAG: hypothetical protein A3G45_00140 [Candidatus Staskawiczbacteria bacterium RIFCSPLOWO2_12_FULL_37_15]|uniref:Uncharacterized protein n=1 Tax=Candidatus Staskawiczbacteria bacterium RIFCSPLOWO2_12_FULL_37_15 TaxID=1802218 RepID=A0A1G2IP31_9BACT|nr:MAG: hypothetical protein US35_C0034G0002 [Parcubacteria group bacterium GW2011_GWA2_37_10]OGZ76679.1 MAG: hypothetical protein A3G45_00140 [Candidatus Staskawiczbacteria bacterium RIFCSPLOWO2_12_FULL_37_15]HLD38103.1 hypothetical protein [Candidatus Nanoarchaeia archaeon]
MNKYKNLAKEFKKEVIKHFGKKCKDFNFGCMVCQSHRIVDDLKNLNDCLDNFNKHGCKIKK